MVASRSISMPNTGMNMQGCPHLSISPSLCPDARIAKRLPRALIPMAGTDALELAAG